MAVDSSASRCGPRAIRTASSSGSRCARFACGWGGAATAPTNCGCGPRLVDPRTAPALELARVYASRWEHELYFREMKRQLRRTALLQSHTVETGAQEIAAIVLASAVIADERARAGTGQLPALRVSFGQVLNVVRGRVASDKSSHSETTELTELFLGTDLCGLCGLSVKRFVIRASGQDATARAIVTDS